MIHNNTTVLNGIALYHPMIEIWSGTVRVKRMEDLIDASDKLPPSEIVSDGRKRIVRKDPLRPLLAIRKRVDRLLRTAGFPFMGGIAVPETACANIEALLPQLEAEFLTTVSNMCRDLGDEYELLEEQFPEWAKMLRKSRLSGAEVQSRCRFDVVSHRVAAPDATQSASAAKRFHKIADAAFPTLLQDIARDAEEIYEKSVKGKGRLSVKTAAVVKRLVDKLGAFSFLDPRVDPMAQALSQQLQDFPATGFLSPVETAKVSSVLNTLSDPESLISQGAAAIQATVDAHVFDVVGDDLPVSDDMFAGDKEPEPAAPMPVTQPLASVQRSTHIAVNF